MTNRQITDILEQIAPPRRQEGYDNTGYQCGAPDDTCRGALICVDITPAIIDEAVARGCNLIITHHPLLFRATKRITSGGRVNDCVISALRNGITVYSCHTAIDNTAGQGVSFEIARRLGLHDIRPLSQGPADDAAAGAVGDLDQPMTPAAFVAHVKKTLGSPVARCSDIPQGISHITRVALCGGAGSDFIPDAIAAGAQAYITSDCKHNHFIDYIDSIMLIDVGHYESEECTKDIFYKAISEKIPNFAVYKSEVEKNPINYL